MTADSLWIVQNSLWIVQAGLYAVAGGAVGAFAIEVIRISRGKTQRVWMLFALVGVFILAAWLLWVATVNQPATKSDLGQDEPAESGEVVAVIDGDTFDVQLPQGRERVRIIGIDTPELAHRAGEYDECYAQSARVFLDALIYRRTVTLESDPTQADTDKYGRLLRHVDINGLNVALAALKVGAGEEATYGTPYRGQSDYVAAMALARETGEGLWGSCGADRR